MSFRTLLATIAAVLLVLAPAAGALEGEEAAYAEAMAVGEDGAGDWGGGGNNAAVGAALGQDLIGASIGMPDAETVNFVMTVTELPEIGGAPEVSRYIWDMHVDEKFVELDGKFTNYSRGSCDPTAGTCPPPRDPGLHPFAVRGNCTTAEGTNVTVCEEIGLVHATFDAASGTITVPVPAELIGAKPCSVISEGANLFGGSIAAVPSAFVTSTAMPVDNMFVDHWFQVPSGDPEVECEEPTFEF